MKASTMRSMPPTGCIMGAAWSAVSPQCTYSRQKSASRSSEKPRTGFRTPGEVCRRWRTRRVPNRGRPTSRRGRRTRAGTRAAAPGRRRRDGRRDPAGGRPSPAARPRRNPRGAGVEVEVGVVVELADLPGPLLVDDVAAPEGQVASSRTMGGLQDVQRWPALRSNWRREMRPSIGKPHSIRQRTRSPSDPA